MNATSNFRPNPFRLAVAALLAGSLAGLPAWAAGNAVERIETTVLPGGKVAVKVQFKAPLAAAPAGFSVSNPPRIALDLPGTENATGRNTVDANVGSLNSVNVVQAGERTRLVLNLNQPVEYETRIEGNALLIALDQTAASAPASAHPVFSETAAAAPVHAVQAVDFRRGENGEGRVVVDLSDAKAGVNVRRQSDSVIVDFVDTGLPRSLKRRLDVSDFGTPVGTVETYTVGRNTRMVIKPRGAWEYAAYQTDTRFVVEVKKEEEARKDASGKPRYVGEKLSLNFQNVEVRSVLQVIADFTGLNIVASDDVTGNLTLRLKDVPWDQALDIVMRSKDLDKRVNGNVVWIAPKKKLAETEQAEFDAINKLTELEPLVTEYIQLNYLRADEAQALLNGLTVRGGAGGSATAVTCETDAVGTLTERTQQGGTAAAAGGGAADQKILTKRGRVTFEPKTNTLIVNDTASKIREVRDLIAKLDVPSRQVLIEARVVIADDGFSRQLGVRLGTASPGNDLLDTQFGSGLGNHNLGAGINVDLPAPSNNLAGSLVLSLLNNKSGNLLNLELQALQADNRGTIVSNPRVVTSNQKPAVILQGTKVPIVTPAAGNTPATVTFEDAVLCLLVDPQILNNDSVIMTVEVRKDEVGAAVVQGNPAINTKRVRTEVRVGNGETVVLGGIFEKFSRNDITKIPFFGDLPILGHLFKSSDRQDQKLELLIFLTPKVLDERLTLR